MERIPQPSGGRVGMIEPDVALTDYALALECGVFAWYIYRHGQRPGELQSWVILFFASTALASICGGTVHGFFLDETSTGYAVLWPLSLLAIGVTAFSGWSIGAQLTLRRVRARWVVRAAFLQLVLYAAVVLFVSDAFWIAITQYVPAALYLLIAFVLVARRGGRVDVALGAWGLALTFVAAALQQLQVAVHPVYFNHNSLYHAVQAVALALVFVGCRGLLQSTGGIHADTT